MGELGLHPGVSGSQVKASCYSRSLSSYSHEFKVRQMREGRELYVLVWPLIR